MSEHWRWETHKSREILIHDYSGMHPNEALEALLANSNAARASGKDNIALLVIVHGTFASKELVKTWKERAKANKGLYKRVAVIGLTGLAATFLWAINSVSGMAAKPFDDENAARDWLIDD